jgi:hypothetical protein
MRLAALAVKLQIADCRLQIGLLIGLLIGLQIGLLIAAHGPNDPNDPNDPNQSAISNLQSAIQETERPRVITAADRYLKNLPETITSFRAARSAGGLHDYFSEGDYWWPDPAKPDGPYIRRDGMSNPDTFVEHRRALRRLSIEVPALTAAWLLTNDERYAAHARRHLRAWFVDADTRMNPNVQYSQAVHGHVTGRGPGVIDTIHLVEVARAAELLHDRQTIPDAEFREIASWFTEYVRWLTTHPHGIEARDAKNNLGTCWVMQVASFASLVASSATNAGRSEAADHLEMCRTRFKSVLVPTQMAADGSFPLELERTKPYAYSLFNLDAMSTICHMVSTPSDNLWTFELSDGRGLGRALAFMARYIKDKRDWPHARDVQHFDEWPMRHPALLFGGLALDRPDYVALWKTLPADSEVDEVVRNFFIRQPLLWLSR